MSHNVSLDGVIFSDLKALRAAIEELNKEQVSAKYEFIETPTSIRGWYGAQTNVDAAIKLAGYKYDIGFTKQPDGSFKPVLEDMFNEPGITAQPGTESLDGKVCQYRPMDGIIGKLSQRYAVIVAEINARAMGAMTRRINAQGGQIHLEVLTN
jgi:hypothetical protein